MKSGKSPGCDGLTVDFYITFWSIIGQILVDTLNYSFIKGELSESQKKRSYHVAAEKREKSITY